VGSRVAVDEPGDVADAGVGHPAHEQSECRAPGQDIFGVSLSAAPGWWLVGARRAGWWCRDLAGGAAVVSRQLGRWGRQLRRGSRGRRGRRRCQATCSRRCRTGPAAHCSRRLWRGPRALVCETAYISIGGSERRPGPRLAPRKAPRHRQPVSGSASPDPAHAVREGVTGSPASSSNESSAHIRIDPSYPQSNLEVAFLLHRRSSRKEAPC